MDFTSLTTIMSEIETSFKRYFGNALRFDISTNIYKSVLAVANGIKYLGDRILDIKSGQNIYTATESQLDYLLNDVGTFPRLQEGYAVATWVTEDSTEGTKVSVGELIIQADNGVLFKNKYNFTIDVGTNSITMVAQTSGESGNIEARSLNTPTTIINGIGTGTNLVAGTGGRTVESDIEYKERWFSILNMGAWNRDAFISAILLAGATSVNVIENDSDTDMTLGTEPVMPSKSRRYYVKGGDFQAIAEAIYYKRDDGTLETGGSDYNTYQVLDIQGDERSVIISRALPTSIYYTYTQIGGDDATVEGLIEDYINSSKIGGILSNFEVIAIMQENLELTAFEVQFSEDNTNFSTVLQLNEYSYGATVDEVTRFITEAKARGKNYKVVG